MTTGGPDWGTVMEAVALEVLGEPHFRYTHEWRYGTRGSLVLHVSGPRAGQWKSWETDTGGGVFDFLQYQLGLDRQEGWQWLHERHLVSKRSTAPPASATRGRTPAPNQPLPPKPPSAKKPGDKQRLGRFAQDLWAHSEVIPAASDHPARRWVANRNLWRMELPLPSSVRWIPGTVPAFNGCTGAWGALPSSWLRHLRGRATGPNFPSSPPSTWSASTPKAGRHWTGRPTTSPGRASRVRDSARGSMEAQLAP